MFQLNSDGTCGLTELYLRAELFVPVNSQAEAIFRSDKLDVEFSPLDMLSVVWACQGQGDKGYLFTSQSVVIKAKVNIQENIVWNGGETIENINWYVCTKL